MRCWLKPDKIVRSLRTRVISHCEPPDRPGLELGSSRARGAAHKYRAISLAAAWFLSQRLSHWRARVQLCWLAAELQGSKCLLLPGWGYRNTIASFTQLLTCPGNRTQVLVSAHQELHPLSQPLISYFSYGSPVPANSHFLPKTV